MPITTKPFVSQAQQRMAFARDMPWAKRWADETDFAKLPKRVKRIRSKAGLKGCTCKTIRLKGEQIAPGITRIHGNLCNVHGRYGPCDAAASGKKPKGGKGRKPKKPVKTPEQRQQERQAQHDQNRADVLSKMNIAPDGQAALDALRKGEQPDPAAVARGGFVQAGLVERGRDGSYRLTGSGRAALSAADQGDFGRAGATVGAARDRVSARAERLAKRGKKPKGKGGGAKKPTTTAPVAAGQPAATPTRAEQRAELLFQQRQQDRAERRTRQQAGDAERTQRRIAADRRREIADKRRAAADKRRAASDARAAARAESAANRTPRRRKDFDPMEDWDHDRPYRKPSREDVERARQQFAKALGLETVARHKETFQVFKDASGADRWISVSSTAYKDRDQEIVSTKALQGTVALADASGYRGPLRFWHVPGVEIGDCDFQATTQDGRFLIESGTFRSPALAAAVKERASGYQVSIGFTHPANEPDQHGVFSHIAIFERSLVPKGRASNPFTQVVTKELRMLTTEKAAALKELLGDETLLNSFLGQVATTDKAAQEGGVVYKDAEAPAWAQALASRIEAIETSLKAAPADQTEEARPSAYEMDAVDTATEEKADDMLVDDLASEGDENFLSPAEISAIATAVVQAITPLLDIESKMAGHLNEMKGLIGGMGTQKDTALSEVREQVKEIATQVADLSGSQPRIMQGGYRASQASTTITTDETKLKEAQPAADPQAQAFGAFMNDLGFAPAQ